jgi:hypothetical protein
LCSLYQLARLNPQTSAILNFLLTKELLEFKVTKKDLIDFENELWKDARKLRVEIHQGKKYIRRFSDNLTSIEDEYVFIMRLMGAVSFRIPSIFDHSETSISFDYIAGTRAFNLLMDLHTLYRTDADEAYREAGTKLIAILTSDLHEFQEFYRKNATTLNISRIYPANSKLKNLYLILTSVLSLSADLSDLTAIADIYEQHSNFPFRDATTKNVVLDLPDLFAKRFVSYAERLATIKKMVKTGELSAKLESSIVYHIDFSGCSLLCPEYDDWVALKQHEATIWLSSPPKNEIDSLTPAELCAKFVRYSRLGGRKLAYRLLNCQGYHIRFGLDDERIYFECLKQLSQRLRQLGLIKTNSLEKLMTSLRQATRIAPETDYFFSWKHSTADFNYYRDIFPD